MKRKLLLAFCALLIGWSNASAAAADYLTGWTEVTSLPTDNSELANYYYVFVATEADLMLAQEKSFEQEDQLTVVYRNPINPYTWKRVVWTLEYNVTHLYGIRNLNNSTHLMQSREGAPWRVQFAWETAQSKWTRWNIAYASDSWTIENKACKNASEDTYFSNLYIGPWEEKAWANGEVVAGNKEGENVGHFKIYQILRSEYNENAKAYPTDVTSRITNPSFDNGDAFAQKKANAVGTAIPGWTVSEGGNYQYYTVGKSRSVDPDNDSGYGKKLTAANGTKYVHIRHGWRNSTTSITQTLENMPEGEYVLTLNHKGATPQDKSPKLTVKATPATGSVGGVKYSTYPLSKTRDNSTYTFERDYGDWSTINYTFFVTAKGNVEIYIGCQDGDKTNTSNDEVIFDNLCLTYKNYTATLQSALDRANLLYIRTSDSDLKSAIDHAQGVMNAVDNSTSYQSTINTEVTTLRTAINTAYEAVEFASGENITFLLENASFESSDALPANVTTSFNNINTTDVYVKLQPVEGWTIGSTEENILAGAYKYGTDYGVSSYTAKDITTPIVGHTNAIVMLAGWGAKTQYKQNVTLPAGRYSVTVPVYNRGGATAFTKNLIGFIENGGTEHLVTTKSYPVGSWTTSTIEFDLNVETAGYMSVGYQSLSGQGSGNMPRLYIDGFTITYTDAENAYAATVASATATYNSATYAGVTGTERTALYNALNPSPAPSTVEEYFTAIDNINDAVSTFTSAKENYDEYAEAVTIASTIGATGVTVPTTASEALTRAHELNVNINTKVNSTYTYDVTSIYVGGWSRSNLDDNTKGQHWSGDGDKTYMDKWLGSGSSSASQTIHLPAGEYILKVAGRGQANATTITMSAAGNSVTFRSKGDSGVGIDKTGAANFASADDTYCNDNNGRGWEWRFIPLSLDAATDITVTLNIARTSGSWASFSDFTILMSSTDADPDDYTALNSAISNAESHILGFEDGEYAPYNNVNALTKLALAKRINPDETNPKGAVTAATAELTGATWTANATDVDAVFNGSFSSDVEGDWGLTGWTRTNNWGQQRNDLPYDCGSNTNYGYYNQTGSLKYGNTGAYIMPLKANTIYTLTFEYASWETNSNNGMTVSVLNGEEGMAAMAFPENNTQYKSSEAFAVKTLVFATGAAGNYVLTLANSGNTVITDVSITKAASQVLEFADGSVPAYAPGTYPSVKITRTLTANRWATAVYPFAVSGVDNIAVLDSYNKETGALGFTSATESTANEPFLMRSTAGVTEISLSDVEVAAIAANPVATESEASLIGAYTATDITGTEKNYVLSNNQIFSVGEAGAKINPYRAYIQIDESTPVKVLSFIVDGTATGVEAPEVTEAEEEEILYNTAGVRVGKDYKGIVINQKGEKRLQK